MSLLKTFRRNRKVAFAALTLMAMISFVILPIVLDMIHGTSGRNPVVLKTAKYGALHRSELDFLVIQRQKVIGFLQQVYERTARGRPSYAPTEAVMALQQIGSANEEDVANGWLMAKRAEELGLRVSDEAVNAFIQKVAEGKLGSKDLTDILRAIQVSERDFRKYLRSELLAMRLREMFERSLGGMPPGQLWDYFLRMNRRAEIEALPVPVADHVSGAGEPSAKEIQALFDKDKDRLYDPNSPEPGFRHPHRVNIEYLRADYDKFADPSAVTDQQIRDYYEKNKDREFREPEDMPPLETGPAAKPEAKPQPKPEAKPEAKPQPKPEAKPETKPEPKPEAKPQPKPEPKPEAKPEPKSEAKPEAKPEPKPEPKPAAKPEEKKTPAKTSAAERRSVFRFASLQAKDDATKTAPAPAKSEPPKPEPKAEKPAPKPETPAAKPETPEAKPEAKPEASKPAAPAEAKPAAPKPPKYKPLDQVKEQIRQKLAHQQAEQKADAVLKQVQGKLEEYFLKSLNYDSSKQSLPPRPSFQELAKQNGLSAKETGLIAAWQAHGFDIAGSQMDGRRRFTEVAFAPLNLFRPLMSKDTDGNSSYLFWKIEDDPEREPKLDEPEVRDEVVNAWKLQKARGLAEEEARRLAEEARKANKPLAEVFNAAGRKVLKPGPFAWLTVRVLPPPISQLAAVPNEVQGIPAVGESFMRTVFGLQPGEVGVASNQPETTVYVIRLANYTPPTDQLWSEFIKGGMSMYMVSAVASKELGKTQENWIKELRDAAGFQWVERPRRQTERE